jgi:hypothetical protein
VIDDTGACNFIFGCGPDASVKDIFQMMRKKKLQEALTNYKETNASDFKYLDDTYRRA